MPSPGTGTSRLTLDLAAELLRIEASFSGLIGTTTAAHVHAPTADPFLGTIGVAVAPGTLPGFPLGVTSGSCDMTFDLGAAATYTAGFIALGGGTPEGAAALLADALAEGRAYLNIHTTAWPGGEIRGFYTPAVPLPPAMALTALAAAALAAAARRRA